MRNGTPQIKSLKRTLALLQAVIADGGTQRVAAIARTIGIPNATAHRQVTTLVSEGYLSAISDGRYVAGPQLFALISGIDEKQSIAAIAAPVLKRLAQKAGSVVQLGTLENDMVTYRFKAGSDADHLFTRVHLQQEAYCSGIGKVLLANLPKAAQEVYLSNGPFVALTANTIIDPASLSIELNRVRARGYAIDEEEIAAGLRCLAVPLRRANGSVFAALSISQTSQMKPSIPNKGIPDKGIPDKGIPDKNILEMLCDAAGIIEKNAFGSPVNQPIDRSCEHTNAAF